VKGRRLDAQLRLQAQNLAMLQEQQAEMDAALINLITPKQQLAATAAPQQQQVYLARQSVRPLLLLLASSCQCLLFHAALPPPVVAAELQLVPRNAQQQQLGIQEAQLQAQLVGQVMRMLGL
jgi:hypothetical protein